MNPAHGLPSARHQRLPYDYMDFNTTQTYTRHLDYIFHAPLHWLDSPAANHTLTLYNNHSDPSQIAEYCLAFIALLVIA